MANVKDRIPDEVAAQSGIDVQAAKTALRNGRETSGGGGSAFPPQATNNGTGGSSGGKGAALTGGMKFALTDYGNAERLAARHGEDIFYVYKWGKFYVWDGTRWVMDEMGEVERRAKETARSIYGEAAKETEDSTRVALVKHAKASESIGKLEAMVRGVKSEEGIPIRHSDLDTDPWLLNAKNGTIDLRTGDLRPHRREDLLSMQVAADYDPSASRAKFEEFLERILPSEAMRAFLKKLFGHTLYGRVSEHILPIFHGSGANGKSTLLLLLLELIGDYGLMAADDLLVMKGDVHPTEQADLYGKRLVVSVENDEGKRLAEGKVKKLTGGEKIRARRMKEDFWTFDSSHSFVLATNHKPQVKGTDTGMWRRLRLVPFNVSIPEREQNKHLVAELMATEASGILSWLIEGCLEWQRDGGLGEPDEVKVATEGYRAQQDVLAAFFEEHCFIGEHAVAPATELYHLYVQWCESAGEKVEAQRSFGERMEERGFEKGRKTSGEGKGRTEYYGIGILSDKETPPEGGGGGARVKQPSSSSGAMDTKSGILPSDGDSKGSQTAELVKGRDTSLHPPFPAEECGVTPLKHTIGEGSEAKNTLQGSNIPRVGPNPKSASLPSLPSLDEEKKDSRSGEKEDIETAPEHEKEDVSASLAGEATNASELDGNNVGRKEAPTDSEEEILTGRERAERLREKLNAEEHKPERTA
jgi:putative DNA primase/helicase